MSHVSVIIPTYNAARFIGEAVQSVLAQSYRNFELIVVDDGSTDDTRAVLQSYIDAGKLTYIYQDNAERAVARNTGIRHASGDYIAFLDADDIWLPNKLQRQVAVLQAHPEVAVVYGRAQYINPTGQPTRVQGRGIDGEDAAGLTIQDRSRQLVTGDVVCGGGSCAMTRRALLNQVGGFDESLSYPEDWDLWVRLARLGPFAYIPEVLMSYRVFGWDKVIQIETTERIIQQHLRVLNKMFIGWPQDEAEREQLRRRALATYHTRVALYGYQSNKLALGREHLLQAIANDASLVARARLVQLVVDRAKLIEVETSALEPAETFVRQFFAHLPEALQGQAGAAGVALGWLHIGCAFDRFRAGDFGAARRLIWRGIRQAPGALANRGVVSIAARSLLHRK